MTDQTNLVVATRCFGGQVQPVRLERAGTKPIAALRLCVGARLITEKIELLLVAAGAEFLES